MGRSLAERRDGTKCPECDGWGTRWEDAFAEYEERVRTGHLKPDAPVADVFRFKSVPACSACGGHGVATDVRERVLQAIAEGSTTRQAICEALRLSDSRVYAVLLSLALEDRVAFSGGRWRVLGAR